MTETLRHRVQAALDITAVDMALRKAQLLVPAVANPAASVDPHAEAQTLLDGGDIDPADLAGRIGAQQVAAVGAQHAGLLLGHIAEVLKTERHARSVRNADKALHVLRQGLTATLDAAQRVLPHIVAVDNADAAIEADAVDEWRRANELAAALAEIRALQLEVLAPVFQPQDATPGVSTPRVQPNTQTQEIVVTFGAVEDYLDAWAEAEGPHPWQEPPLDALRWSISEEARPWLPTVAELRAALDVRRQRREAERIARLPRRSAMTMATTDAGAAEERRFGRRLRGARVHADASAEARERLEMGRS